MVQGERFSGSHSLLTVSHVAELLSVSERKVWRLISEGKLTGVRVGLRGTRILASELDEYIQKLVQPSR